MRKLIFLPLFVLIIIKAYAQAAGEYNDKNPNYLIQNNPNPFSDNTVIRFGLESDCNIKLIVTNQETGISELLVDGEISKGEHGVFFKSRKDLHNASYRCKMEVYSLDKNELIHSSEIKMIQVK